MNSFIRSISKNNVFRTFDYHRTMRGHCIVYNSVIKSKCLYIMYFVILCLIMEKWFFEKKMLTHVVLAATCHKVFWTFNKIYHNLKMDKHLIVVLCCAFVYLIFIATIETIAMIFKNNFRRNGNDTYELIVSKGLNHSSYNYNLSAPWTINDVTNMIVLNRIYIISFNDWIKSFRFLLVIENDEWNIIEFYSNLINMTHSMFCNFRIMCIYEIFPDYAIWMIVMC